MKKLNMTQTYKEKEAFQNKYQQRNKPYVKQYELNENGGRTLLNPIEKGKPYVTEYVSARDRKIIKNMKMNSRKKMQLNDLGSGFARFKVFIQVIESNVVKGFTKRKVIQHNIPVRPL